MNLVMNGAPVPSDYFGVLWALAGIKDALILEHGATGTAFYSAVSFGVMNRQSPKGILFTTGLDEEDVVMGREDKIVNAVKELDEIYHPQVISLTATAVTSVIGLDLEGLRRELQPQVNARLLAFSGGGFAGDYTVGIKDVFKTIVDEVVRETKAAEPLSVNLIGPTIDNFNHPSDLAEIKRLLRLMKIKVDTIFTQSTRVEELEEVAAAALNIVTRDIGLEAARRLEERFGTPYHYGLPFGIKGTIEFLERITEKLGVVPDRKKIAAELERYGYTLPELSSWWQRYDHLRVVVACPFDYAAGLTRMIRTEWNLSVPAVVLPLPPEEPDAVHRLTSLGVETVLTSPSEKELRDLLARINPHVLFGSADDFKLAPFVPVKIHAALPAYDHIHLYDGTPFVGLRGNLYLTQTLINLLNTCRERIQA